MVATELVTKLSFSGSLKPLDSLNAGLTSAIGSITKVASVFSVGAVALNGFMASTLASTDAQLQLSKEIGVSVEEMQQLGYVASVNGSSAETMSNSLQGLAKKIGEASIQGSADFSRLGISIRDEFGNIKNSSQVMEEIGGSFKRLGLTVEQQQAYMEKFGIDKSLLQTLNLAGGEMDSLKAKAKALGVVTQAQAQQVANFNDSFTSLKYGMNSIQKQVAIAFAPSLGDLADGFTDLLISNKDMIQNGLKKFFEIVNAGLGAIFNFGKLIYSLIDNTIGLENALMIAGAGMLYLNRAMYMNPIGAIVGLIAGLIIVVDDLMVGLDGGKSAIADFFKEWFNFDILSLIQNIGSAFTGMIDGVKNSFNNAKEFIQNTIVTIMKFIEPLLNIGSTIKDSVGGFFGGLFGSSDESNPTQANSKINESSILNPTQENSKINESLTSSPTQLATSNINNNTNSQSSNIVSNDIKIEVKTDNPQLAGESINNELSYQLKNANSNFNRSGR